ncbi:MULTISPECIES: sensor histidine kinase [Metabacillus]|uniref:Sensor histidine kinase n=1 Tax=Metabacillus indicus TaxID=246786 RepID=A0A084GJS9_METID|nr:MULTISPECIES: sensor histidine kinase [Metabacillus]KEZ47591.1 histidine kinase [Metabacillus indicus]KEZ48084.1 histidine kinase [Metabacillus indicus LMG 22858]
MSSILRQMALGAAISVSVLVFLSASYFFMFPLNDWSILWEKEMLDLPFIYFVPAVSVAIGLVLGLFSGIFLRSDIGQLSEEISQLARGKYADGDFPKKSGDFEKMWHSLRQLQKHLTEQTKLSQRLANEKAEEQEKRIQKIVSEERNRLARELHDSVSQQLFAASMMMSAINESSDSRTEAENRQLQMVEQMIHQSQLEMRALLLHLRPAALKGKTLQEGMKDLLQELSQKVPMEVSWKMEDVQLDKGIEDHLFRILQESVSNTLRHSKAETLEVLFIERDDLVLLRVIDDGIGFKVDAAKTGSYGLQNMHERAAQLGGTLKIVSFPGKGTKLEVKIPLVRGEKDD